jgi:hypothetical protein
VSEPVERRAHPLAIGAVALPLLLLTAAAVLLPPAFVYSLIGRGVAEGHPGWVVLGGLGGAAWLFGGYLALIKPLRR